MGLAGTATPAGALTAVEATPDADVNATSTATVTTRRTSTSAVAARRTSTSTVLDG
jgi:hypothetical protein